MLGMNGIAESWGATKEFAARRRELGLSQRQLAEAAGTSQSELSRIEQGQSLPPRATCEALARILRCPLEALFDQVTVAPDPPPRDDLVSMRTASLQTGVPRSVIDRWLNLGLIADYGVGGRGHSRCRFVALGEVREQQQIAGWLSGRQVASLLRIDQHRVSPEWAEQWGIVYGLVGAHDFRFEPNSVNAAAKQREEFRERFATARETGLLWRQLRQLENDGLLEIYRGEGNRLLVDRKQLADLLERFTRDPPRCWACNQPVEIGHHFHRECAGPAAMRDHLADPERRTLFREQRSAGAREWWDSEAGHARREYLSEIGWPKARTERVELQCFICHRTVLRKASEARRASVEKRRTVCPYCDLPWRSARMQALYILNHRTLVEHPTQPKSKLEKELALTLAIYKVGQRLEHQLRAIWPKQGRRRPPIATDLLIEVFFLHGATDDAIERMLNRAMARGAIEIPGLRDNWAKAGYVRKRRRLLGIIRAEDAARPAPTSPKQLLTV